MIHKTNLRWSIDAINKQAQKDGWYIALDSETDAIDYDCIIVTTKYVPGGKRFFKMAGFDIKKMIRTEDLDENYLYEELEIKAREYAMAHVLKKAIENFNNAEEGFDPNLLYSAALFYILEHDINAFVHIFKNIRNEHDYNWHSSDVDTLRNMLLNEKMKGVQNYRGVMSVLSIIEYVRKSFKYMEDDCFRTNDSSRLPVTEIKQTDNELEAEIIVGNEANIYPCSDLPSYIKFQD